MVNESQASSLDPTRDLDPQVNNAADVTGVGVDLSDCDAATVIFIVGTITDGTHTPSLEHAEDDGTGSPDTWEAVGSADQVGTLSDLSTNEVQWAGYKGTRRHLRSKVAVSGATTGGDYGAIVVKGVLYDEASP